MRRGITFTVAAMAFVCGTAAAAPLVTYDSPCECRDYHGKGRLTEKNDATLPPADPNAIQAVTPSDIFSWQGPSEPLTRRSGRIAAEQKWYAVTGRVVAVKAETDGDIHIALHARLAINRESSLSKYRQNRNGVQFVKRFSVGRGHDSLCTFNLRENSRSTDKTVRMLTREDSLPHVTNPTPSPHCGEAYSYIRLFPVIGQPA